MFLLIEPPGKKHQGVSAAGHRPTHSITYGTVYEDDLDTEGVNENGETFLIQKLGRLLVGKSSSSNFSDRWKREFSQRPSWCDADMSLQQIKRGKARGNRAALYSRSLIQKTLYTLGLFVQHHACLVIFTVAMFFSFCCYGLRFVHIETDIVKLWVARGGRLEEELNFLNVVEVQLLGNTNRESGLGGAYQVVIHTAQSEGDNILTKDSLLEHVAIMERVAKLEVEVLGEKWALSDICFKPPPPDMNSSPVAAQFASIIEKIIPCVWITPIDCFWEGAKAIGPHPSIETRSLGIAKNFISSLPDKDLVSWRNINPQAVIDELSEFLDLGNFRNFFRRADIGVGYLDRWCIDPLDPECPPEAPNYFRYCDLIPKFLDYAKMSGFEVPVNPEFLKREEAKKNEVFDLFDFFGRKRRDLAAVNNEILNSNGTNPAKGSQLKETESTQGSHDTEKPVDVTVIDKSVIEANDEHTTLNAFIDNTIETIPMSITTTTTEDPNVIRARAKTEKGFFASHDDSFYNEDDEDALNANATMCAKYTQSLSDWMRSNPEKWTEFLHKSELPVYPDFGKVMTGGCRGFAKQVMSWPQDLIIGGAETVNGTICSAVALQSVFLVASPADVYNRFKKPSKSHAKPNLNLTKWNVTAAQNVLRSWQRSFTHNLYNHEWNFVIEPGSDSKYVYRRIHPLASTSVADMLEEFCKFNYIIIFVGYFLMLLYALQSQMKRHECMLAVDSCMGLAMAGVFTITFSSIAGLGLATWFGIQFNAATTQIVPFLALGIGVDNIFLLLHNYRNVMENVKKNEIGILMKETGMSVLMSSINNILSFLAGTLLPIPALRSFCAQCSILLTFNLIAVLTIFPAIIFIDLRRRKCCRRDVCCCSVIKDTFVNDESYTNGIGLKPHIQEKLTVGETVPSYHNLYSQAEREDDFEDDEVKPWTLHAFLRHYYIPFLKKKSTKISIIILCFFLLLIGFLGMHRATYGLEMSDVLPEHTAPAAFLRARDRYFSFYPMFAVLKGPNLDYSQNQRKIDNYRTSIAKTKHVVKLEDGEPSEKYWLTLMRTWLRSLQEQLDDAIEQGLIDPQKGTVVSEAENFTGEAKDLNSDANIAYRLACSYGNVYNCTGRVGKVRFVDESGTINVEGFYNYLTAWYNSDNMMYHVSQASFIPAPPIWSISDPLSRIVPPAEPFIYSQIPFYLTNLSSTPVIIEMIKEIRAVCNEFSNEGLPNFPSGIAFTFWEQYLHLSSNLSQAICVITLAVFCVISIILCNPWAAGIIALILMLMTVELTGFLGLAGVKLNPISAVTIITAVGIGVEFTAHVVFAFLTSLGNRNERMAICIDKVFVPVIHGALSTLLGIIMLAFSEFEFVVKYFFVVMSALIVIGVVNGLVLLPVLLSLIGPPCEVEPVDGSGRLSVPPPMSNRKREPVHESQAHRRNCSDGSSTSTLGPENCSTMLLIAPAQGGNARTPRLVANKHARSASAHIVT